MADDGLRPVVFLDFDGTISQCDVVDVILERYADPAWLDVEREWQAGRLGSRACLREQMALVRAAPEQIDTLLDAVQLDAGFVSLLECCARHAVRVHIISDGFDYCIQRILGRLPNDAQRLLAHTHVFASHLEPLTRGRWRTGFAFFPEPCTHGCATCKPAAMRALNPDGAATLFVGDGLSDRYAAAAADVVFAKNQLATSCADARIPSIEYRNLADVAAVLDEGIGSGRVWRRLMPAETSA